MHTMCARLRSQPEKFADSLDAGRRCVAQRRPLVLEQLMHLRLAAQGVCAMVHTLEGKEGARATTAQDTRTGAPTRRALSRKRQATVDTQARLHGLWTMGEYRYIYTHTCSFDYRYMAHAHVRIDALWFYFPYMNTHTLINYGRLLIYGRTNAYRAIVHLGNDVHSSKGDQRLLTDLNLSCLSDHTQMHGWTTSRLSDWQYYHTT